MYALWKILALIMKLPLGFEITSIIQAKNSGHRVTWVRRTELGLQVALSGSIALDHKYHEFSTSWKSSIFQAKETEG